MSAVSDLYASFQTAWNALLYCLGEYIAQHLINLFVDSRFNVLHWVLAVLALMEPVTECVALIQTSCIAELVPFVSSQCLGFNTAWATGGMVLIECASVWSSGVPSIVLAFVSLIHFEGICSKCSNDVEIFACISHLSDITHSCLLACSNAVYCLLDLHCWDDNSPSGNSVNHIICWASNAWSAASRWQEVVTLIHTHAFNELLRTSTVLIVRYHIANGDLVNRQHWSYDWGCRERNGHLEGICAYGCVLDWGLGLNKYNRSNE